MSVWMHLELYFKDYSSSIAGFSKESFPQKKPEGAYKDLISYLNRVVNSSSDLIRRYFFLFEEKPHVFLALELIDVNYFEEIKNQINRMERPEFISSYEVKLNTGDENHPESVLDLFWASAKYAFFRVTDSYVPGYYNHDETKIIHCFCNQLFTTWDNEILFYINGLFLRGVEKVNVRKGGRDYTFPTS